MRLLERLRRGRAGGRRSTGAGRSGRRTPSLREMRARMRTEKAEARLLETEARIHAEAAKARRGARRAR
jgi:hypothetical protein